MKSRNRHIDLIFRAIADPTRREIFHVLVVASAALSITQITEQFDISRQGVTKHIKTLEEAGLVSITAEGRERFCTALPKNLRAISVWLSFYDNFWQDALDRLGDHLDDDNMDSN